MSCDVIRINVCGALIYGAITSINSNEAEAHAELYYEEIRKMSTDIIKIAKRTGYSIEEIRKVKNYLFMEQHALFNGYKRFDPSFEIAQTWQRLMSENMIIEPHGIVLIEHELYEMSLISEGLSQDDVHLIAAKSYDYAKESREYYVKIRKHNKRG